MRLQVLISCLGIGTLALSGMLVTDPFASAQDATPPAPVTAQTADDEDDGTSVVGTPLLEPVIDLIRAQEIALEGHIGAAVIDVELGGENGVLFYSVTLASGIEVDVDATSGEVVRTEEQNDEQDEDQDEDQDEVDDDDNQEDNGDDEDDDQDQNDNGGNNNKDRQDGKDRDRDDEN
jgi:hypothetical protein